MTEHRVVPTAERPSGSCVSRQREESGPTLEREGQADPIVSLRTKPLYRSLKRIGDIVIAGIALIIFAPLMGLTAVLIRRGLGHPVLFRQLRAGRNGRPFTLFKFRTMSDARDEAGDLLPDARRMSLLGVRIRTWSLDELPQLWNVLRGDMSLVGPRPLLVTYVARYNSRQRRRLDVVPGITGWAQVQGRNSLSWNEKFERDVWYTEHADVGLDIWILILTLVAVLRPKGVSADQHATMPEFLGEQE